MRNIKTAVITGPTGAVGEALCRLLLSKGVSIYAICRPDSSRKQFLPRNDNLVAVDCDISELRLLPDKMNGEKADAFFHLAWKGNDGDNRNNMRLQTDNIKYTLDACHAAKQLECYVFVGTGSQAEYGRVSTPLGPNTPCFPENGYGMAKLCAGQMSRVECQQLDIAHIWTRILSVYGPFEQPSSMTISTIMKLLNGEIPAMTTGEQLWDYLYADDAADALYRIANSGRDGAVYTLGSGKSRPLREYIDILRDTVDPSAQIAYGTRPYAKKQIMHLEADISSLTNDTGFIPETDYQDGIRRTVEWVRSVTQCVDV